MAQVYIVHGYGASPDNHWFPWLEEALATKGIACHRLAMPNSDKPNLDAWLNTLADQTVIDNQTVVVGHSLGCITWLTYLARNFKKPAGAVLVSGFYQPLDTLPELTVFSNVYAISPPLAQFKSYVVAALDDAIVPHHYSDELAKHLKADYIRLPEGGHFLDREGCIEFPLVLELIEKLLQK